jgi:hypothetical protein
MAPKDSPFTTADVFAVGSDNVRWLEFTSRYKRQPQPGEKLFEFLLGHDASLCELRDHGPYGVKAQFDRNEEFRYTLVIRWVEEERRALEASGLAPWTPPRASGARPLGGAPPGPAAVQRARCRCWKRATVLGAAQKNGMRD